MPCRKVFSIFEGEGGLRVFLGGTVLRSQFSQALIFPPVQNSSSGLITSHVSINILKGKGKISLLGVGRAVKVSFPSE